MPGSCRYFALLGLILAMINACANEKGHISPERMVPPEGAEALYPNVVKIFATSTKGPYREGFGFITGEVWNRSRKSIYVATALHTIRPKELDEVGFRMDSVKIEATFFSCQKHTGMPNATVKHFKDELDLALLEIDCSNCPGACRWRSDAGRSRAWKMGRFGRPLKNQNVWFIGYKGQWHIPEKGTIQGFNDHKIMLNIGSTLPGSSGAPLIDDRARIVGMLTNDEEGHYSQAIHIASIENAIRGWGMPFDTIIGISDPQSIHMCDPEGDKPLEESQIKNAWGMRFVRIGGFGFYIQKTEVTQCQWKAVMGLDNRPFYFDRCGDHCPAENISWNEAHAFIEKLSALDRAYTYQLPTEEQWESACVGERQAENHPSICMVTSSPADTHGLFGMTGNVREWCETPFKQKSRPRAIDMRVVRGGSWRSSIRDCGCNTRDAVQETLSDPTIGFRLIAIPTFRSEQ